MKDSSTAFRGPFTSTTSSYPPSPSTPSSTWLTSISLCCAPLVSCFDWQPRHRKSASHIIISWPLGRASDQETLINQDDEKRPESVVYEAPMAQPRPVAVDGTRCQNGGSKKHKASKKSKGSNWSSFSRRGRLWSDASLRRPQISAPTDFRHVSSSSFQFSGEDDQQSENEPPASFRPLELTLHAPNNAVSPLLPHFEIPRRALVTPPPAYRPQVPLPDEHLVHETGYPRLRPFHIPRKPYSDSSSSLDSDLSLPPRIPPKSPGRARARTSPEMDRIKERVASAMNEMERLQKQIDDVIERQSLYTISRPSTAQSMARTVHGYEFEPMPSIPALPLAAPSFSQRLNSDIERPQTAPIRSPLPAQGAPMPSGTAGRSLSTKREERPLPPPLPLVLRPPLRKKKSFSRVSTWLFPGSEHSRDLSLDSVTNLPRPVKGREGFYQCVATNGRPAQWSASSLNTVSSWASDDKDLPSAPTAWSPESTPSRRWDGVPLERCATFGSNDERSSVGVAM
jgi:hypothetical protein